MYRNYYLQKMRCGAHIIKKRYTLGTVQFFVVVVVLFDVKCSLNTKTVSSVYLFIYNFERKYFNENIF